MLEWNAENGTVIPDECARVGADHHRAIAGTAVDRNASFRRMSLSTAGSCGSRRSMGISSGGKQRGKWQADFSVKPAVCEGSGSLNGVSLDRLADVMNDEWIAGVAKRDI